MLPSELAEIYGPLVRVGPIHAPGGPHPSVQRLLFADGTHVIAKRYLFYPMTAGHPHDLLETETEVTRQLSEAGCRTPAVLATDPAQGIIYFEYVPGPTLDDAMQTSDPVTRARLADRVVDAFVAMQETFVNAEDTLEHRVAPGTDPETVRSNFVDAVEGMGFPVGTNAVDLARELATHPLQLGPTDYNARNILITNDDTPCFIDLGKVGYDWPERRLVQYATSLGANRPGARVKSLLDPIAVERWRRHGGATTTLDGHHFLLHAIAAARGLPQSRALLLTKLSEDERVGELRRLAGKG